MRHLLHLPAQPSSTTLAKTRARITIPILRSLLQHGRLAVHAVGIATLRTAFTGYFIGYGGTVDLQFFQSLLAPAPLRGFAQAADSARHDTGKGIARCGERLEAPHVANFSGNGTSKAIVFHAQNDHIAPFSNQRTQRPG